MRQSTSASKLSVVVVDDDEAVRDSLAALLQADGLSAHAARFSPQLMNQLEELATICVVIDLDMLGDAAADVIRALRQHDPPIAAIFTTGRHDRLTHGRMIALGAAAIVEKPIRSEALLQAVRSACNHAHAAN